MKEAVNLVISTLLKGRNSILVYHTTHPILGYILTNVQNNHCLCDRNPQTIIYQSGKQLLHCKYTYLVMGHPVSLNSTAKLYH
jgi:hypothetical protein